MRARHHPLHSAQTHLAVDATSGAGEPSEVCELADAPVNFRSGRVEVSSNEE